VTITVETRETSIGDALRIDRVDLQTLALSDRSIVAQIPQQMPLGRHVLSLDSRHAAEQAVPFDEVSLYADPVPPVENVGDRANPTIHVEGLPVGDQAVIDFEVGGSAALEGGGNTITVPVQDGVAKCSIVGVRPGHAIVRYHLRVTLSR
jgi:hypothetical protein